MIRSCEKKILALLLTAVMLLGISLAEAPPADAGGASGTPALVETVTPAPDKTAVSPGTDKTDAETAMPSTSPAAVVRPSASDTMAVETSDVEKGQNAAPQDVAQPDGGTAEQAGAESVQTLSVRGTITWKGFPEGMKRPSITVVLLRNGVSVTDVTPVSTKGASYAFGPLAKCDEAGGAYKYRIRVSEIKDAAISVLGYDITVAFVSPEETGGAVQMIGENGLPFDGDEQPADEGEEPSGGDKQPYEGEKTPLGGGEESAGEDELPAGGDERLNGTNEELPCTDTQPVGEDEPLSSGDGEAFGLIGAQPAAEPLPEGDEAVQSVIVALETLSAAADAGPQDGNLAELIAAASAALDALTDEQRAQIPAGLLVKLDAVRGRIASDGPPRVALRAWQGNGVCAGVRFVNVPAADKALMSIGVELYGASTDDSLTVFSQSATLSPGNNWAHTFRPVNGVVLHILNVSSLSLPAGYTATLSGQTGDEAVITVEPTPVMQELQVRIVWNGCAPAKADAAVELVDSTYAATYHVPADGNAHSLGVVRRDGESYSLMAEAIAGYECAVAFDGAAGLFTVTYAPARPSFTYGGTLAWHPGEPTARGDIRVSLIRVNDGAHMGTATLPAGDNDFRFADVPQSMDDGSPCVYGVRADDVSGFTKATDSRANDQSVVHYYADASGKINLRVNVSWRDGNDRRKRRPEEITAYLYANGEPYPNSSAHRAVNVKLADGWTNVFPDLPGKDGDGKSIRWSVRGKKVPRYYTKTARADGWLTDLKYTYGSASSEPAVKKTAPLVGDPLVYNAAGLTLAQWTVLTQENAAARTANSGLAASVRSGGEIDFDALTGINRDVAAWLILDGTAIDYPVVRGTDNAYYLNRLYNKEINRGGTIFIDNACSRTFSGRNTVIYGHNMSDGSMFAGLLGYKQQSYYDTHPVMRLYTPAANYQVEVFAAFATGDDYDGVARVSFSGSADFTGYVNECVRKSGISTGVSVGAGDKIITLVTCSDNYDNTRYLVMGRLTKLP